nr:fe-S cluster assembly protein dre2-like [Quercus suber]POF16448.1 fe-s cluster assembly protein dre2 [Quercus suber]
MAPAVTIDNEPDFDLPASRPTKSDLVTRTLLLAPASVAAHPETLARVAEAYDRDATDIQMLDRLAMGLVALPASTYDVVLLLSEVEPSAQDNARLLDRNAMKILYQSMKTGAKLRSHNGSFDAVDRTEAILAGLVDAEDGMSKPDNTAVQTVKLSFGRKKANAAAVPANAEEMANAVKRKSEDISTGLRTVTPANGVAKVVPNGVGFVDSTDDLEDEYEDDDDMDVDFPSNEELERAERIDPDTLLTEADREKPIIVPDACKPNTKRRRACKDCTCGLAQKLEAEDKAKRANADANLAKLNANDLAEVDFTVQGKVGSCGNCALGDAFRCDGCPYIGLPAFKPGEEVRLLDNEVQL